MNKPYAIVHSVHEAYRGLPVKLARITGKSEQWYRSHGYAPADHDSLTNGNPSDVDRFMAMCELYEAAEPGAGRCLASRVHAELTARFTENDLSTTQRDLHLSVIDEGCDVNKWLASHDLDNSSRNELLGFEKECDEALEAIHNAKAKARAKLAQMQLVRAR